MPAPVFSSSRCVIRHGLVYVPMQHLLKIQCKCASIVDWSHISRIFTMNRYTIFSVANGILQVWVCQNNECYLIESGLTMPKICQSTRHQSADFLSYMNVNISTWRCVDRYFNLRCCSMYQFLYVLYLKLWKAKLRFTERNGKASPLYPWVRKYIGVCCKYVANFQCCKPMLRFSHFRLQSA